MCRNIKVLHNFAPPATPDEIGAAALQYVRKVSGSAKPSSANQQAFERAAAEVTAATRVVWNRRKSQTPRSTEGPPRVTARSPDHSHRWIEA